MHYIKGCCELEKGIVEFVGGMYGVSTAQTRYYTIYAIRDQYPHIDFCYGNDDSENWVDYSLDKCIYNGRDYIGEYLCG